MDVSAVKGIKENVPDQIHLEMGDDGNLDVDVSAVKGIEENVPVAQLDRATAF